MLGDELPQLRDTRAIVADERGTTGIESTAAPGPDRSAALGCEFFRPHLDRPSVLKFVAGHPLDVVGVERQKLLIAEHGVVSRAPNRVVLRPGSRMLVDVL